jgi:hypothetical protein
MQALCPGPSVICLLVELWTCRLTVCAKSALRQVVSMRVDCSCCASWQLSLQADNSHAGKRLLSTMLGKILALSSAQRTQRAALRHWRADAGALAADRGSAVARLRRVHAERLAVKLRPALVFWRRMTVVLRAERAKVRGRALALQLHRAQLTCGET